MMTDVSDPQSHELEDSVDGCICDVEFGVDYAVSNVDLPPATGGVHSAVEKHDNEDAIDGCDVDFNENNVTADGELPAAVGGCLRSAIGGGLDDGLFTNLVTGSTRRGGPQSR